MSSVKLFPGQVQELVFSLDQVEVLASSYKGDVFWAFSSSVPLSIADVARDLGKTAQGIHYHVNSLIQVGLLLAVGERKRRSRTEKLYVRAGFSCIDQGKKGSKEHNEFRKKAFAGTARMMVRETGAFYDAVALDSEYWDYYLYRRAHAQLTKEQMIVLKERLYELMAEVRSMPVSPDDPKVRFMVYACPTVGESAQIIAKHRKQAKKAKSPRKSTK